jgi:thiol-disulfide isomerase/thioredoxin
MKVAICIVGNPRSFKRTFPSFKKNLLKQTPADIFIHTYNQTGQERSDVNVDGTAEEYIELYSPVRSKIEELNFNFQMLQTMEPYFKSCYEVMQLVKNYEQEYNFQYDIIIKTRADIEYLKPLDIKILDIIINNKNTIFVNHVCDLYKYYYGNNLFEDQPILAAEKALKENITSFKITTQNNKEFLPSDYVFLGDRKSMEKSLEEPFKQISKLSQFSPGGERLLAHIVDIFNINYGLSTLYIKYNCLR